MFVLMRIGLLMK